MLLNCIDDDDKCADGNNNLKNSLHKLFVQLIISFLMCCASTTMTSIASNVPPEKNPLVSLVLTFSLY